MLWLLFRPPDGFLWALSEGQACRPRHPLLALALTVLPEGMAEVGSVPRNQQLCECKPRAGWRGFGQACGKA